MTLYELSGQYLELLEMAEEDILDQGIIKDTLEGLDGEIEDKAEKIGIVLKTLDSNVDMLEKEINRLELRKKHMKNNMESLKRNLENCMLTLNKKKFKTNLFSFNIQKNPPSLKILDKEKIPSEFKRVEETVVIDNAGLKKFLKENIVDYAELIQTESLRIR